MMSMCVFMCDGIPAFVPDTHETHDQVSKLTGVFLLGIDLYYKHTLGHLKCPYYKSVGLEGLTV